MLKKILILLCSLITVSTLAMTKQDSDREREKVMVRLLAELASGLTPGEIHKRMVIDYSEISKVSKSVNGRSESYTALLDNGDILEAQYYKEEKLKGRYDCSRYIKDKYCHPHMPELPLDEGYFHVLKKKYEELELIESKAGHYNDDHIFILPID